MLLKLASERQLLETRRELKTYQRCQVEQKILFWLNQGLPALASGHGCPQDFFQGGQSEKFYDPWLSRREARPIFKNLYYMKIKKMFPRGKTENFFQERTCPLAPLRMPMLWVSILLFRYSAEL